LFSFGLLVGILIGRTFGYVAGAIRNDASHPACAQALLVEGHDILARSLPLLSGKDPPKHGLCASTIVVRSSEWREMIVLFFAVAYPKAVGAGFSFKGANMASAELAE
jgi:hypothetical protein